MTELNNPYYQLYIDAGCAMEVLVNDVIVFEWKGKDTEGTAGRSINMPINQALLESGKYKVIGKMYPDYGSEFIVEYNGLSIDFYVASIDNLKATRVKFQPSIEQPWHGMSENIKYPYFEIATEIEVELPFVLDGWQHSVMLSERDKDELFKQVLDYYQQIRLVLKEHNASKFLEMSKEKMKLQEQAFYFDEERKKDFLQGVSQLFAQNLEVEELNPNELQLEIMGHGKLVRLMHKDGTQPLQFKSPNPEKQSNIELEVKLHMRSREKGFSII